MEKILEVNDISISFGGVKAVDHVSFSVDEGEIVGLIGPNGSGKSTCVNLVTGVYPLDTGTVHFRGKEIPKNMGIAARTHLGMGRTFQSPRPFSNLSVFDNIYSIAMQTRSMQKAREKTEEILEQTNLTSYASTISSKLSIERRKWLDLARILATDPSFIMMDEVMAGLNPTEMDESLEIVRRLNKELGITFLFIEHVMRAVVNLCPRVIVLNEGHLLAEGNPREVLKRDDVIAAYLGKELKEDA